MYRPNESILKTFSTIPIIGSNLENLIVDFNEATQKDKVPVPEDSTRELMFYAFILGVINVISPKSKFNSSYIFKG